MTDPLRREADALVQAIYNKVDQDGQLDSYDREQAIAVTIAFAQAQRAAEVRAIKKIYTEEIIGDGPAKFVDRLDQLAKEWEA